MASILDDAHPHTRPRRWRRHIALEVFAVAHRVFFPCFLLHEEGPAVDGDTGVQGLEVDTLPWEDHGKVLTEILEATGLRESV